MDEDLLVERVRQASALSSTYGKGLRLAEDGAVAALETVSGSIGDTVSVSGRVEGSHGELYRTEVSLDLDEGEVIDYSCTCVAAASYPGMCKHEVALVLEYLARQDAGPVIEGRRARAAAPVAPTVVRGRGAAASSPQISRLMNGVIERRVNEAAAERGRRRADREVSEPVELQLTVLPAHDSYRGDRRTWCIKLKACRGKAAYVVKNIAALLEAYRSGAEMAYGRNLSFAHVPDAFTAPSQALLDIMDRVARSQRALFLSRWRYQSVGRGTEIKELPVSDADLIDILHVLGGGSLTFEPDDGPYGSKGTPRRLAVAPGDPEVPARLVPSSHGYDLRVDSAAYCLFDGAHLCLLDGGRAWLCSEAYAARAGNLLADLLPFRMPLHIAQDDLPEFCRTLLPGLRESFALEVPENLERLVPPEPSFTFRIGIEDGLVTCDARVSYGDWENGLYGEVVGDVYVARSLDVREPSRDLVAEYRVMDVVEEFFPGGYGLPGFDEADDELLYDLLTTGVAELAELGTVLLSERLQTMTVRSAPQLSVSATVKSGLLDLEVGASGLSARDLAAYLDSYKRKQKFVRLSNGDIMRMGEGASAVEGLATGLGIDPADLALGVHDLPVYRVPFVDDLLKRAGGVRLSRNDAFREIIRDIDTYGDADFPVPDSLRDVLRGYQRDGFRWLQMLEHLGFGGILADDMGLGKTLQVIAHVLACKEAAATVDAPLGGPALVVCPASLVYNWMAELARFAPQLDAVAVVGTKAARTRIIRGGAAHDVLVTSYDLMKRDIEAYTEQRYQRVVLDEAQYIKNPGTRAAKCAKLLPATVRFALTGTPIENRLAELWSIFDFLMPGILGTRDDFSKRFEGPVEAGEFEATNRLQCLVAPFILRRLKTDVLSDLPEKSESTVLAHMEGEQRKLYLANQDRLAMQVEHRLPDEFKREKLKVLAELMRLRQICCDPRLCYDGYRGGSAKLDACMELVRSAVDGGHGVLVFSQFVSMLDLIGERLDAERLGYLKLTGATAKEERARLVASFQAGEARVFLISLKAGGVGLNLTAADVVIHYDPWWNLAAQNQATDRAHRIGQQRAVSVFKLIAEGTIEEKIAQMQERKHDLAQAVLGGEEMASSSLTKEDVLALLGA